MTRRSLPVVPTGCTLGGTDFEARVALLRSELLPHLRRHGEDGAGEWFEFDRDLRATLEDIVALERQCCETWHWSLVDVGPDAIRLVVQGLPPAESLILLLEPNGS